MNMITEFVPGLEQANFIKPNRLKEKDSSEGFSVFIFKLHDSLDRLPIKVDKIVFIKDASTIPNLVLTRSLVIIAARCASTVRLLINNV